MPWSAAAPNLGFSTAEPWLPVGDNHHALAVDVQDTNADSVLQFARECLTVRSAHQALRNGAMQIVEAGEQRLVFERASASERVRCTFNLSRRPAPLTDAGKRLISVGDVAQHMLGPYAAVVEIIG
jgi:alpha-glucosidase